MLLLSSADFFKMNIIKKFFQEHNQSVKQFRSGGPDLGPNGLQRLTADDKSPRLQAELMIDWTVNQCKKGWIMNPMNIPKMVQWQTVKDQIF